MKKLLLIFLLCVSIFASEVKIAAAANLKEIMPILISKYKHTHPKTDIKVTYASSRTLMNQILKNPNSYDIYLSANEFFPKIIHKTLNTPEKPKIYANGILTLFSYKKITEPNIIDFLLKSKCIVIANPSTAPYGKAAIDFLNNLWILSYVEKKLIYAKNVANVLNYIKKCDAALIAKSLISKLKNLNKTHYFLDIPDNFYFPITQGSLLLSNNKEAKDFYRFLFSQQAKNIFKKYGYK